jgi:hypothetical protein
MEEKRNGLVEVLVGGLISQEFDGISSIPPQISSIFP